MSHPGDGAILMDETGSVELTNRSLAPVTLQRHSMTKSHTINFLNNTLELLRMGLEVGYVDMVLRRKVHVSNHHLIHVLLHQGAKTRIMSIGGRSKLVGILP